MSDIVEGRNAVLEALRGGRPLRRILLAQGAKPNPVLDEIERTARTAGVAFERVPKQELDRRSERGSHQGVLALAEPFQYAELQDVIRAGEGADNALVIALDHITDPGNLGAVARSAEVVGAVGLLVPKQRSAEVTAAAHKASAGALSHLPLARVPNLVRALEQLKEAGYWVAGASEKATTLAWDAPLEGRLVLVLGSEGTGLSRLVEESCDFLVSLPVVGHVGSLNVAQATTVLAYEWARRTRAR